jgi:hypothetical protein
MDYDDALTECDVRNTPIRETSHALKGDGDGRWLRPSWLLAKGASRKRLPAPENSGSRFSSKRSHSSTREAAPQRT